MKVLALTPHAIETSPGHRFRLGQWIPALRAEGVEVSCAPFASQELSRVLPMPGRSVEKAGRFLAAYARQLIRLRHAGSVDLIYLFREAALLGPALIESCAVRTGTPMVFDFDDAVFVTYESPSNGRWSYLKFPGKAASLCRMARQVMAGNDYLASYASRYSEQVTVIPTTIDTDVYRPDLRRTGDRPPTIGWTGSHSTAAHLRTIVPALERLAAKRPYRLVVIGIEPPPMSGVQIETRPWRAETEAADLADVDVGIMPLPDDEWTRGKCGLKALQFMGLGIPTVVSPVGVNTEIVRPGENGFLANDTDEWVAKLDLLLDEPETRRRFGESARRTVVERYSARAVAPKVLEVFRRTLNR